MIKFYLLFGIYLTTVYSSKNSDKDIFDEIHHEEVLNRIKRLNQPNTTTPFTCK